MTANGEQNPFHAGEVQIQRRLGVADEIGAWASKVVRRYLPDQHREFYAELPFLIAAARDALGRPWATLLAAEPGFASSPDPLHLRIRAEPVAGDALAGQLGVGSQIGLLGIDLAQRRRNRVNGSIANTSDGFAIEVGQAFGNCPQYIRERDWEWLPDVKGAAGAPRSRVLTAAMRERVRAADTFFIATGGGSDADHVSHGMDASHRGGSRGFVDVQSETQLVFPDYAGNNHFNTLGNLVTDPRAGLLFVDFESGGMLQLTGRCSIDWDSPAVSEHPQARRLIVFELDEAIELEHALPLRWADARREPLRLVERGRESADVVSFVFESASETALPLGSRSALPNFEPGQHLPIEVEGSEHGEPLRRTYSLTSAPGEGVYRISVKREERGEMSRLLHDRLEVGAYITARPPAGDFTLLPGERPVVLVSAGIGVTPMLSMLKALVATDDPRQVHFVHAARDRAHHALADEVRELEAASQRVASTVFYSQPAPGDRQGIDFDERGRLDAERLLSLLPSADIDLYLCGPVGFMSELRRGLEASGIATAQIHTESFGPQS